MLSIRNLLCAVLVTGVLLSAPNAEARFGKRSESTEQKDDDKPHDASAVGDDDDDDKQEQRGGGGGGRSYYNTRSSGSFWVDLLVAIFFNSRPSGHPTPSGEVAATSQPNPLTLRLGANGAALGHGAGLDAFIGVEGQQWGVDARALALILPTDDGSVGTDSITLTNMHLTLAVLAREKARLRIEGGFSSAHAPDLTVVGPSMALSFEACLVGPLDLELRAQGTPYPYRQLDAHAGLAVHLNTLVLRGGVRTLFLDDNGLVDGVVNQEAFSGPYLGLGFTF